MKSITVHVGRFATEENAAKCRKIAERLKGGESVTGPVWLNWWV